MSDSTTRSRNLLQTCQALYRYRWRGLLIFFLGVMGTLAALMVWPRSYDSESKLFVRLGRESVALDPTATSTGQTIALNESRETEINSLLEMLSSRTVLERVVDELGPDAILERLRPPGDDAADERAWVNFDWDPWLQPVFDTLTTVGVLDDLDRRERAIQRLIRGVRVWSPHRSHVAIVAYSARTPHQAQLVVDAIVRHYREQHVEAHRIDGSLEFFDEQTQALRRQLREAHQRLQEAKNQLGIAVLEERRSAVQDHAGQLEIQVREVEAALAAAHAEIAALRTTLSSLPARLLTDEVSGLPNQAADAMRERLYELQVREQQLLTRYTRDHPSVVAVRQQVEEALEIFDRENERRQQQTSTINPTYQPLELQLLTEQSRAESLQAQHDKLTAQLQGILRDIAELNRHEIELAEQQRQVDLLEAHVVRYAENLEQSRIDNALALDRISNINVVQPATLSAKPSQPRKIVVLGLGLILAIGGAFAVMLLSDQLDQSVRSSDDLEEALDLAVLATLPQLRHRSAALDALQPRDPTRQSSRQQSREQPPEHRVGSTGERTREAET